MGNTELLDRIEPAVRGLLALIEAERAKLNQPVLKRNPDHFSNGRNLSEAGKQALRQYIEQGGYRHAAKQMVISERSAWEWSKRWGF